MEMTRSDLATAIRRVGLLGTVDAGLFDNILKPSEGTDYSAQITALQQKDTVQDSEISTLGSRVTVLESTTSGSENFGPQITQLQQKNVEQDTRLTATEGALLTKASLISGKVPYEQLPEFPVGRKVNVANRAARLTLTAYADLTIAYESDTGDAWGLDANDDPAIDSNWSKLGNALGVGVASFNGRTGNIGPLSGDYTSNQITETLTKRFVTSDQITEWTAKETTSGSQSKATTAQNNATAAAKTYADSTFVPLAQKGAVSGVTPLDANRKIPTQYLPTNLPTAQRIWRDVKGTRNVDAYTTHTGGNGNEMMVYVRSASNTSITRHIVAIVRQSATGPSFLFRSDVNSAAGDRWQHLYLHVPHGWQYSIRSDGGSTTANIEYWYEMY